MDGPHQEPHDCREYGNLVGYGVARPCRVGFKIGPLFAERAEIAERIARDLMARIPGQQVQMDLPEANQAAVAMADRLGFHMSFGCMRLYYGQQSALPIRAHVRRHLARVWLIDAADPPGQHSPSIGSATGGQSSALPG